MVFVCPSKEESEAVAEMSSRLKEALHEIENQLTIGVKPVCVPCCVPLCDYPPPPTENKNEVHKKEFDPPKVMVCYREPCKKPKGKQNTADHEEGVIRLHQSKSRELRASILYTGCECEKRNGLQVIAHKEDDCPRTGCHGSPECLTSPPTCGPSEFCGGKHLGKKDKYSYLKKDGDGSKHVNGEPQENKHQSARYKCFAATVEQPIVIPLTQNQPCCPCPVGL